MILILYLIIINNNLQQFQNVIGQSSHINYIQQHRGDEEEENPPDSLIKLVVELVGPL